MSLRAHAGCTRREPMTEAIPASVGDARMNTFSKSRALRKDRADSKFTAALRAQPVTYTASTLAILASIGLGGAGVWRMAAPGVEAGEAMAYIGAAVAFTAIAVSEMTAAVTLLHADRRDAQDADARKWMARGVFAVAILANMLAGHQGAGAISDALIGPQREPIERRLAAAQSSERVAEDAASRFDEMTGVLMATYDADLDAARSGAAMAVTARRGTMSDKQDTAQNREALRARTVARDLAAAEAETAAAAMALANAPKPMSEAMRWALALMFELVKSVLIWVATPQIARRREPAIQTSPSVTKQTADAKLNTGGWDQRRLRYGPSGRKPKRAAPALSVVT